MTNEQFAAYLTLLVERIDREIEATQAQLPAECHVAGFTTFGNPFAEYPVLSGLVDLSRSLSDEAKLLRGKDGR